MGKRITVRLNNEGYARLHGRSQEVRLDISFLVREAIAKYLYAGSGPEAKTSVASQVMPAEAFKLTGPYRAWCGDLRVELRKRLLTLLALSHVTAEFWSKTKGIRDVYVGLLGLCQHLGIGEDCQT